MIRRLLAACALVTIAATPLIAQEASNDDRADAPTAAAPAAAAPVPAVAPGTPVPVRIVTFNTEWWSNVFLPRKVLATTRQAKPLPDEVIEVLKNARSAADEENWEIARSILAMKPDVLVIQEGCSIEDLTWFNNQMLRNYFEWVHVFKSNDERGQNIGILVRPGFKRVEVREDYLNDPDTDDVNPRSDKLFARGPAFAKLRAPNGTEFWVGTNHTKSKSGNNVDVTKWRIAEGKRTNQIVNEVKKAGPAAVFFLGDMNDELGYQEFEQQAGGSSIEATAGSGADALLVLTKQIAENGAISYHGGRQGRHRSFIDHAFATPEAAKWVKDVRVFTGELSDVASDHYPVVVDAVVP